MKLRPASHLILGMVRMGARSGYAVKKAADVSTRFFWPMSLAQVYPELARLEDAGLLSRSLDSHGSRERFAYEATEKGEEELSKWLNSPREGETQFRDEGILRLFFADNLPRQDQLALVQRLRERAQKGLDYTRAEIIPSAEALKNLGIDYPARVAQLRAETYKCTELWLAQLEAEIGRQA
jgi:PadR family transcriptional regulator, regulatory protein AphA